MQLRALIGAARLYVRAPIVRQSVFFAAFGLANTATDLLIFLYLIRYAHLSPLTANLISVLTASLQSYALNGLLTFKMEPAQLYSWRRLLSFLCVNGICVVMSLIVIAMLKGVVGVVPAKLVSIGLNFSFGFVLSRTKVFVVG